MKKSSFKHFWEVNEPRFPKVSEEDARKLWEAILKHREQHPGKTKGPRLQPWPKA